MTLPSSGPLSMNQIRNEFNFGGSSNIQSYYRGGVYVPNTPANAAIPTSGAITFSNFYGTQKTSFNTTSNLTIDPVSNGYSGIHSVGISFSAVTSQGALAYNYYGTGTVPSNTNINQYGWASGNTSELELQFTHATYISGALITFPYTSGGSLPASTWFNAGTDRLWWGYYAGNTPSVLQVVFTCRTAISHTTMGTATVNFHIN